ncbi:hypothetical protein [Streptomyces marokkonensis]|uniref:hypothetical protein n=1 Tax=Streptomyces marokkonensis TaxID=324855 RepID=UPI0011F3D5BC|nr:hypothetical protein [Streptomyces marokkonensis]
MGAAGDDGRAGGDIAVVGHADLSPDTPVLVESAPAVWDGSPSDGRDATAHLVTCARARGVPVEAVWPAGAAREAVPATGAEG